MGEWLDSGDPRVAWSDRGLMHGLGLFETILAVNGRPVHLDRHLARLQRGTGRLGWEMPCHDLKSAMAELLERNQLTGQRTRIRLALTAGSGQLNELKPGQDRVLWLTASPLSPGKESVSVGLSLWRRNEHSALVGLKCASYAENLVALDWARQHGHDEVLFLNTAGKLCEASSANLFLVMKGRLYTPGLDSGCLPGVTRELLMELAAASGIQASEASLQLDDLQKADECFLTSATRGVVPVTQFDGRKLKVGPLSSELARLWEETLTPR